MALPAYNAAKHHCGLGIAAGSESGFMLSGYVKRSRSPVMQRVHQGGTNDYLGTTSESSWTQDDYSGGAYQAEFRDAAMFARSKNMMPNQLSPHPRAYAGLRLGKAVNTMGTAGADLSGTLVNGQAPIEVLQAGAIVAWCFSNRIVRMQMTSIGGFTTSTDAHATVKTCFFLEPTSYTLFAGGSDGKIYQFNIVTLGAPTTINNLDTAGATIPGVPTMIAYWGDMLFVCWNETLYVRTTTGAFQKVGAPKGSKSPTAGKLGGTAIASQAYNGQLYMLVRRQGGLEGYVAATTGTQISTVAEIPYALNVQSMKQYAGRLYIGGVGYDQDGNDGHAELFELTGSSLRLVKSWTREKQMAGNFIAGIPNMDVYEGCLGWVNTTTKGLEFYDASQDAFWGGPTVDMNTGLTAFVTPGAAVSPLKMVAYRDQVLVWMTGASGAERGIWKLRQPADGVLTGRGEGAYLDTSDFGPEPGRKKRWGKMVVRTRGAVLKDCWASIDGGLTWLTTGVLSTLASAGDLFTTSMDLSGASSLVSPGYRIRFRFMLWRSDLATSSMELNAHTLHFAFMETDRHQWQLTIPALENVQQEDDTVGTPSVYTGTPAEVRAALWNWLDQQTVLAFKDRDGTTKYVNLADIVESQPVLNAKGVQESFFSVMLQEL